MAASKRPRRHLRPPGKWAVRSMAVLQACWCPYRSCIAGGPLGPGGTLGCWSAPGARFAPRFVVRVRRILLIVLVGIVIVVIYAVMCMPQLNACFQGPLRATTQVNAAPRPQACYIVCVQAAYLLYSPHRHPHCRPWQHAAGFSGTLARPVRGRRCVNEHISHTRQRIGLLWPK